MKLFKLFPYKEWRAGQREIAERIHESTRQRGVILVEYPTGAGKTIAVLLGALETALESGKVILYLARTKNQAQAPFRELRRLIRRGANLRMSVFRNKKEMCALKNVEYLGYEEFLNQCRFLRESGLCKYYENAMKIGLSKADFIISHSTSPLDFIGMSKRAKLCPYEVARTLAKRANVIIGTYRYLFDECTRENFLGPLGLSIDDLIVIIDEAHNLPNSLSDMYSYSTTEVAVKRAMREVRAYFKGHELEVLGKMINSFRTFITKMKRSKLSKGELLLSTEEFIVYVFKPSEADELMRKLLVAKYLREGVMKSYAFNLYLFIESVYKGGGSHVLYMKLEDGVAQFHNKCIIPARMTRKLFDEINSCILMSGTLPPKDYLSLMLGIPTSRITECRIRDFLPKENKLVLVCKDVTTRYSERSELMFKKIAAYINTIYEVVPKGVLLTVFPSYDVMKATRLYLTPKSLVAEKQDTRIEDVEKLASSYDKLLILAVAGGKVVEGVEFIKGERSLISAVIVAGMPFPEPDIPNRYLLETLTRELGDRDKAWDVVFLVPAVTKVRQAVGRAIRFRRDRAAIVILDRRFYSEKVSKYSEDLYENLVLVNNVQDVVKMLSNFYNNSLTART